MDLQLLFADLVLLIDDREHLLARLSRTGQSFGGHARPRVLEPPIVRELERFSSDRAVNPPRPPDSSSVRTFAVGRSRAIDYAINARGMRDETNTNVLYSLYVQTRNVKPECTEKDGAIRIWL